MKLSLVVPCYNEEENIPLFYNRVISDFKNADFDYEIVFVNDGSQDGTLRELKKLLSGDIPVKIVTFSRNFGKEAAMYAGLENSEGDYVTIIDADLQQSPALALEMVRTLDSKPEYDCIAAYQENRGESKALVFFKDSFYKIINKFADTQFRQGASDFRTFRRPMVEAVLSMGEYFRFSKGLFSWVGFNTKFIPYTAAQRAKGTSKWSFFKLFKYALEGIFGFTTAPLRIAGIAGVISLLGFLVYLIYTIVRCVRGAEYTSGNSAVLLILAIGGIHLICLGLIGEYLARTYIQGKGRPIYIAKDIIKNDRYGENNG
ncbi:MAG: glycosyltransferase family 2 protein [Clostridia bacterium]|nr:glycosyltransferase family 2 protein [Clostridia bacterium]